MTSSPSVVTGGPGAPAATTMPVVPTATTRLSRKFRHSRRQGAQPSSILWPPVEAVVGLDEAHGARRRAHDDRVGDRAALHVADTVQVVAGRDAGGGAHDRARGQLLEPVLPLQVEEAELAQLAGLVLVARLEPRLHLAPDAEEEGRRQHALRRAAHSHQDGDAGA